MKCSIVGQGEAVKIKQAPNVRGGEGGGVGRGGAEEKWGGAVGGVGGEGAHAGNSQRGGRKQSTCIKRRHPKRISKSAITYKKTK